MHNRTVNVNRQELLQKLKENKEEHIAEFNEAMIAYRAKLAEEYRELKKKINYASDLELSKMRIVFSQAPASHEADYDEVIDMLSVSVDETIRLDKDSFKAFYKNEWNWTAAFKTLVGSYK